MSASPKRRGKPKLKVGQRVYDAWWPYHGNGKIVRVGKTRLALEFDAICEAGECDRKRAEEAYHQMRLLLRERDEAVEKLAEALESTLNVLAFESTIRRNAVAALAEWRERKGR